MSQDLLTASGSKIALMIRQGETTSQQAVSVHIEKIKKVNPAINAVVYELFDQALEMAKKADKFLAENGPDACPPLHGVPCTIKECFELVGTPHASGLVSRKHLVAQQNAPTVERLLKAGVIPLGKTNTSELCMWMESDNKVYGRTGNPYNPCHIAGGSSGGEGSIIGAGASPFGLGSDIGGSIRMPAFFNGVFGHKPTAGLIPNTGQYPPAEEGVSGMCTTGPLCRRAEDLMLLVKILAGPDGRDPGCVPMEIGDPTKVDISRLKVLDVPDNGLARVKPELAAAQRRAAMALEKAGCKVVRTRPKGFSRSLQFWSARLASANPTPFGVFMGGGKPLPAMQELLRLAIGKSEHTLPGVLLALLEKLPKGPVPKWLAGLNDFREQLRDLIGEDGVMLLPPYSGPAPRHVVPQLQLYHWIYTGIINALHFPATQVPLGLSSKGLPLGVQVVGIEGNDATTIAVANWLEKEMGGWVMPKGER
jgi:fatty acid amide hydrolase 2